MFFETPTPSTSESPPQSPSPLLSTPAEMPTRNFLSQQALSNTLLLYPNSAPHLVTSKDPRSGSTQITILSTSPSPAVLFSSPGTSTASFEALLAATETAVHAHLQALPNPEVEAVRTAVDTARLQRENNALLEELQKARGPMKLVLPVERKKPRMAEIKAEPAPKSSLTPPQPQLLQAIQLATQHQPPPQQQQQASPPAYVGSGLPKSRAFRTAAAAETQDSSDKNSEEEDVPLDSFDLVSPRTIPQGGKMRLGLAAGTRWGDGEEAADVAAWIKAVTGEGAGAEALTPPLTPPIQRRLPRSRKFEGR
ncbi:hypothetical protein K440DRAFT_644508 [Wilcoxina mikolae CBS 423.85]|nr:hypothetical protein K440DRAFT_644508 [Wilcoxina mikolae CBS 423.85]